MRVLGLTGNIACGKSTVASLLRQRGAGVLDADQLVHELYSDTRFSARVAELFDSEIRNSLGMVDRKRLSTLVFADAAAMRRLELLVHPAVAALREEKLRSFAARKEPPRAVVLEAVKLLESGQGSGCDEIWCVTCSPQTQLQRMMDTRHLSAPEAQVRIEAQPPFEQKQRIAQELGVALVTICNDGSLEELEAHVEALWSSFSQSNQSGKTSQPEPTAVR